MLILTRRSGETILIGDNIQVTVVDVDRNQVRIGIDAPQEVKIVREELLARRRWPERGLALLRQILVSRRNLTKPDRRPGFKSSLSSKVAAGLPCSTGNSSRLR